MRKHLYLITEHENADHVGRVNIMDQRVERPTKNEEGPITTYDKEAGEFQRRGSMVGMGYVDFDSEAAFEATIGDAVWSKLLEIDPEWLAKAGLDPDKIEARAEA